MLRIIEDEIKLSMIFCGDLAPINKNEKYMIIGSDQLFADVEHDLKKADLSFVNLECPLTHNCHPILKDGPKFQAHPDWGKIIAKAGFQIVGLANNHIMDMGQEGLFDTLKICKENNLVVCGAGENLENAQKVLVVERKGLKIAIIAVAEHEFSIAEENKAGAAPLDPVLNYYQIQMAKQEANLILMIVHGGNEYFPYPRPKLRRICHYYIDLGVDAVICHHAHLPGVYEYYKEKPIIYSLGNFLFDSKKKREDSWELGYMAKLIFHIGDVKKISLKLIPYRQSIQNPGIIKLSDCEKSKFLNHIERMRETLEDNKKYMKKWKNFCNSKAKEIIACQYLPIIFPGIRILSKFVPISFLGLRKTIIPLKYNLIRCESHRELLIAVLENLLKNLS